MLKPAEDIISLPIEITDKIADSKFRLVHVASQRVRQLSTGAPVIVATRSIKDTTIALEESLTGAFKVITGEEARKSKEEFRKRQEQAKLEEQLSAKEEEIRKELSAYLSEARAEDLSGETGFAESREDEAEEAGAGEEEEPEEPENSSEE